MGYRGHPPLRLIQNLLITEVLIGGNLRSDFSQNSKLTIPIPLQVIHIIWHFGNHINFVKSIVAVNRLLHQKAHIT
jgi:hypothetical protein